MLAAWRAPVDVRAYLLKRNLCPVVSELVSGGMDPLAASTLVGHRVRCAMGDREVDGQRILWAAEEARRRSLPADATRDLVVLALLEPADSFDELLERAAFRKATQKEVSEAVRREVAKGDVRDPEAAVRAVMGRVRAVAWGNVPLRMVAKWVEEATR